MVISADFYPCNGPYMAGINVKVLSDQISISLSGPTPAAIATAATCSSRRCFGLRCTSPHQLIRPACHTPRGGPSLAFGAIDLFT